MDPRPLDVHVKGDETAGVVTVRGEVDMANCGMLRQAIADEMRDAAVVVVDLSAVTFLDSSGLAVLVSAHRSPAARLRLVVETPPVKRILAVSGLDQTLEIHPTLTAALAAAS